MLKLSLATSVIGLSTQINLLGIAAEEFFSDAIDYPRSPPVLGWRESIPTYVMQAKAIIAELNPPTQAPANKESGECGRNDIQRFNDFYPAGDENHDTYELRIKEQLHVFNPAYPAQKIWGYDGIHSGPTFHARYGRTVSSRLYNELPQNHVGFSTPEVSMHLHNLHTSSESDGFPGDYFSPNKARLTLTNPGLHKDHCYPNVYAGYDKSRETDPNAIGDPREAPDTMTIR